MRACLVGYADIISTIRLRALGMWRSRACRTAIPATRAARSGSGTYTVRPSASNSLKENGTVMSRPSNSGTATWVATSSGDSPSSLSAQVARLVVRQRPCRIGTSSAASSATSQASSSPPAEAPAGFVPPAASTVTTMASAAASVRRSAGSAWRSEAQ